MTAERVAVVAVHPERSLRENRRLFSALETAFDVRFVSTRREVREPDGMVLIGPYGPMTLGESGHPTIPVLSFTDGRAESGRVEEVRLLDSPAVDRRLRNVVVRSGLSWAPAVSLDEDVLAAGASGPAWFRRRGPVPRDQVSGQLPTLGDGEALIDALRSPRALALLALVHFLRSLRPRKSSGPGLRAAFVFDDPNLRRTSYGFIDFRRLIDHADAHGYHTAMAMIPLDARRPNRAAVGLFAGRPDRLSLVMHGNNHSLLELMQGRDSAAALSLASQALRRIARFERETGLGVDRVMMPPHGMCSSTVTGALGALGYDALCAKYPCPWSERPPSDRVLAGWSPAEFVSGCAVVPRFPITASATEIALRAFLDQPLILYGHHGDLACGLDLLAEVAAKVNQLGDVRWCSVGEIVRGNYELSMRGGLVAVSTWANRVRIVLPAGATALTVQPPPAAARQGLRGWAFGNDGQDTRSFGYEQALSGQREAVIWLRPCSQANPETVPDPPAHPWPRLRRGATEARDRLAPLRARRRAPTTDILDHSRSAA